jgi:linoleoyl-CoA desaturase
MAVAAKPALKFIAPDRERAKFQVVLKKRVDAYFKDNSISPNANAAMVFKTVVMLAMYLVPYGIIMSDILSVWGDMAMFAIMGLGMSGIGMSVMHDANHGSYSANPRVNTLLGYTLNLVGASAFNWRIQHNVLHHTYTNIHTHDEDIREHVIFRLSPHTPIKPWHRFQHLYALPFYGLMTISWMLTKDFKQMVNYRRLRLTDKMTDSFGREVAILLVTKVLYVLAMIVLPLMFTKLLWWQLALGLCLAHYITGLLLAVIFQLAHVVEDTEYPLHTADLTVENQWAIHQMETTANFAPHNPVLNWFVGGLNYQVEHHLFANICHVHYPRIAPIVKATAEEFGVPYYSQPTFWSALGSHLRMLRDLGKAQPVAA